MPLQVFVLHFKTSEFPNFQSELEFNGGFSNMFMNDEAVSYAAIKSFQIQAWKYEGKNETQQNSQSRVND